jgi:hypothetical protein
MLPPCSLLSMTCRFAVPAASHWPSSVQIASNRFKLGQQFPLPRPPISGLHADSAIVTTSRSTSAAPGRSTVAGKEAALGSAVTSPMPLHQGGDLRHPGRLLLHPTDEPASRVTRPDSPVRSPEGSRCRSK